MGPGTRVHLYNNAVLWVYKDGTLKVEGVKGSEVTFQGMRLEPDFRDIPGQWGKIWLSSGSKNNSINFAIIKNGGIGLQVDTVVTPGIPTVKLNNTIIKNMTAAALYGLGAHIWSSNCVFANSGQYVAALSIGGKYRFEHCTFANYWSGERTTPLLNMSNYYISGNFIIPRPLDSCYFKNCILDGSLSEEIGLDSLTGIPGSPYVFRYEFDHCLLKTGRNVSSFPYTSTIKNLIPNFKNTAEANYRLKIGSPCIDAGDATSVPFDLDEYNRTGIPDQGAYEFH
jgi:hypothetical protein